MYIYVERERAGLFSFTFLYVFSIINPLSATGRPTHSLLRELKMSDYAYLNFAKKYRFKTQTNIHPKLCYFLLKKYLVRWFFYTFSYSRLLYSFYIYFHNAELNAIFVTVPNVYTF